MLLVFTPLLKEIGTLEAKEAIRFIRATIDLLRSLYIRVITKTRYVTLI
jgi:hypothetical protein